MEKRLLLLLSVIVFPLVCMAQQSGSTLELHVEIYNPGGQYTPKPKSPILPPVIMQNNYELSFVSECLGYVVCLIEIDGDENLEVYTSYVSPETSAILLPSYLSGTYQIKFFYGYLVFYGWIAF